MAEAVLIQSVAISSDPVETPTSNPELSPFDCIGREISYTGGSAAEIDATTVCSEAKEFILGLQESGVMSVTGYWKPGFPAHTIIREAMEDMAPRLIQVTFEDGAAFRVAAYVMGRFFAAPVDGVVSATFNFLITGEVLELEPGYVPPPDLFGSLIDTLSSVQLVASGTVVASTRTGSASIPLAALTVGATGVSPRRAVLAQPLLDLSVTAQAVKGGAIVVVVYLEHLALSAQAAVASKAALAVTLEPLTLSVPASDTYTQTFTFFVEGELAGQAAVTLEAIGASATGSLASGAEFAATLDTIEVSVVVELGDTDLVVQTFTFTVEGEVSSAVWVDSRIWNDTDIWAD